MKAFGRFAWSVLAYNLGVIVWGAYVRATGSGAGCGRHWPMCNGQVVPRAPAIDTLIEFTHRSTSGLALLLVVVLFVWTRRAYRPGHAVRKAAAFSLSFLIVEALLGAGLVLFGWVATDVSLARVWAMPLHLANTFLLVGALALTATWSSGTSGWRFAGQGHLATLLVASAAVMLLVGMTGAIAALGDTLFPTTTFAEGLQRELASEAHLLLRLRILHPFVAVLAAALLVTTAVVARRTRPTPGIRRLALGLVAITAVELGAGLVNLVLLAPVWLQLVHLFLADLNWIALVLLAAAVLGQIESAQNARDPALATAAAASRT